MPMAQACLAWYVPTLNLLIIVCIVCIYKIILGASQKYFVEKSVCFSNNNNDYHNINNNNNNKH